MKKIKTLISKILLFVFIKLKKIKDKIDNKRFDNFAQVVGIAFDNGYREIFIAKQGVIMYEKDGLYFNQSGIYEYKNGFRLITEIKYKKIDKILELLKIKKSEVQNG